MVRNPFPIPIISTILLELEGFTYATALDLNMDYYTIRLHPESSKTCIIIFLWGVLLPSITNGHCMFSRHLPCYVGYVWDTTCLQRVQKQLLPDVSADMSDMLPYVAETCHKDISFSRSSKTQKRHNIHACLCHYNTTINDVYVIST